MTSVFVESAVSISVLAQQNWSMDKIFNSQFTTIIDSWIFKGKKSGKNWGFN